MGTFSLELLNGDPPQYGIIKIDGTQSYEETVVIMNRPEYELLSIYFANESIGYVVGIKNDVGTIWKNSTGINTMNTVENNYSVKVYPNPTSSEINIILDTPNTKEYIVSLTDMTGKQVYTKKISNENNLNIDVQKFPKGTYILKVNNYS
ncbi:MAG: T9SS type A sorting domain-containing protein [Moheibacter sp.]